MQALLQELGHRLPASPRIALVGPRAASLRDAVRAAHPQAEVTAVAQGDPRDAAGPNLDLVACADLAPAQAGETLATLRQALRPGGALLLVLEDGWTAPTLRAALEAADLEVQRIGPASRTGLGLRARAGLPARTLVARALRHPGTAQH
ncbi:hypothetical protein L6R53_19500 [Myxococcota bacterium]|nr:hypothetical protein [Myxococcota bacterium]